MSRASYQQTGFIGGEVSPLAQGRSDLPWYRQALSLSLNGMTVEEGAWVRRSGTEFIIPTRNRTYAKLIGFDGSATCSFGMVFTAENVQFVTQSAVVFDNTIGTISASTNNSGSSIEITLSSAPGATWNTGDQVMIVFPDASSTLYPYSQSLEVGLRNRMLTLTGVTSTTQYELGNDLGVNLATDGSMPSSWPSGALVGAQIARVLNITTPYTAAQLPSLRAVQIEYQSVILAQGTAPQVVQITTQGTLSADPVFSFTALGFVDGPYLDPFVNDGATISAYTGSITFTDAGASYTFVTADVGRHLRIFTQPALWASGTTYSLGNNVTDSSGAWWTSLINSNTGNTPGQPVTISGVQQLAWAPAPQAGSWAWGKITAIGSGGNSCTVALDATIPNMTLQSSNSTTVAMWQLGAYTASTYPTCGLWANGRLWLGGAIQNRFDTTISNGVVAGVATFSPTDPWDNVLDDSGITETFNSTYTNQIQWFAPEDAGILVGTLSAETLVFSSATNDPITPTSIDSRIITKFGSLAAEPVRAGMATIFVQKYGRRVMEYLADAFSGKFSGRHLNEWSKHLSTSGVSLLAYQEEPFPCVWTMMNNGLLTGTTYRRFSRFVSEPPNIAAAFRVLHGRQRLFTSMCVVPGKNGLLDRLFVVTNDPPAPNDPPVSNYFVEIMQPLFDEGMTSLEGWFCDEAPGNGAGNSGYDCGGGNIFTFNPTGGVVGSDATTANVENTFPYSSNGTVPAVGTDIGATLQTQAATYFDGTTALYMLPPQNADTTQLSLSVWVASEDFPQQAGALFSSPALSPTEAAAKTTIVSSLLGVDMTAFGNGWQPTGGTTSMLVTSTSGSDVYPTSPAVINDSSDLASGQVWNHVMLSVKSNGNGTITLTAALNETVIASSVVAGDIAYHGDMWPYATQPGAQKADIGPAVWCIGGTNAAANDYTISYTYGRSVPSPYTIPTLAEIVQSLLTGIPINELLENPPPGIVNSNTKFTAVNVAALPAYLAYLTNLQAQQQSQQNTVVTSTAYSGGTGNLPADQPTGGYAGYRGSVAELLIWPGSFIDWTNSTNRGYLHKLNTITNQYVPLSPGYAGSGTALGAPYVYLTGSKDVFPINRANGKNLTITGAGLIDSPLSPP